MLFSDKVMRSQVGEQTCQTHSLSKFSQWCIMVPCWTEYTSICMFICQLGLVGSSSWPSHFSFEERTPNPVWVFWRRDKSLAHWKNQTTFFWASSHSLVTVQNSDWSGGVTVEKLMLVEEAVKRLMFCEDISPIPYQLTVNIISL
jgi:hypothetical protein